MPNKPKENTGISRKFIKPKTDGASTSKEKQQKKPSPDARNKENDKPKDDDKKSVTKSGTTSKSTTSASKTSESASHSTDNQQKQAVAITSTNRHVSFPSNTKTGDEPETPHQREYKSSVKNLSAGEFDFAERWAREHPLPDDVLQASIVKPVTKDQNQK